MKKLRCGVIGVSMGRGHIQGYQKHPQAEVTAIADVDAARAKTVAAEFKVPGVYTDPSEMIRKEDLDIVSVVTPNKFHKPQTLEALAAGCHVLCEKPMAMNAAEAHDMLAAARTAGRRIMIDFSQRFTEPSQALKREVDAGTLGDVYFGRTSWLRRRGIPRFGGWFGQKALSGGGPLIDLGVHRLDLALWLMGYPVPRWVMASTYNPIARELALREGKEFDVEDLAVGLITFDNGATLEVEASWATNIGEQDLMETRLCGTKGGLIHRNIREGYQFEVELYVERNGVQYDLKPHAPVPAATCAMGHFVDSILKDEPHMATGEEGLTVMQLLDAIYASAAKGEPVKLDAA